jgi:pimeloyl-ACP methyl ester carboxylesterase
VSDWLAQLTPWRFTAGDGTRLSGWQPRRFSARPIIYFRHGNGFCGLVYRPLLERLAARFDIVICDAQGHGDSGDGPFRGWNAAAVHGAEHIAAQRGQWPAVPLIGLGHSFGGALTLLMAAQGVPFAGCILLDPIIPPPLMPPLAWRIGARRQVATALNRRADWGSRDEAADRLRGRGIFRGWPDEALRAYVEHALADSDGGVTLKCRPQTEAAVFAGGPRRIWRAVRCVPVPMHIVHGTHTMSFVARSAARAARRNPLISAGAMAGGHCFMQERPADSAAAILAQLRAWGLCADDTHAPDRDEDRHERTTGTA